MKFIPLAILFIIILLVSPVCAGNDDAPDIMIIDIHSDITAGDITLFAVDDISTAKLIVELSHKDRTLQTKTIILEPVGPGSSVRKAFVWDVPATEDGAYTVKAAVYSNDIELSSGSYQFVHGRPSIPNIAVDSVFSDSAGMSLLIRPHSVAAIIDVEFMLIEGNDIIFSRSRENIAVHTAPMTISENWDRILEGDKVYEGRAKIYVHSTTPYTISFKKDFNAEKKVTITDIFRDRRGSSVTLQGASQVPFEGYITFTVMQPWNHPVDVVSFSKQDAPLLLIGDDETIEAIWDRTLEPGKYRLFIEARTEDGRVVDAKESIIEVEERPVQRTPAEDSTENDSPLPGFAGIYAMFAMLLAMFALSRKK